MRITVANDQDTRPEEVRDSAVFQQWLTRQYGRGITVRGVRVNGAYKWGAPPALRMLHVAVDAYDDATGRKLDGTAMIRGATVDILAVVRIQGETQPHVVFVRQPRVAAMQLCVTSNPAGMLEEGENVTFAGLRELAEELDEPNLEWSDIVNLGEFITGSDEPLLVSPGGSDETSSFLAVHTTLTRAQVDALNNKFGGAAEEDEHTHVLVKPLGEAIPALRTGGLVDMKALLSLLMYKEYAASKR